MYKTDHIFTVLPVKKLVNQDGEPTTPHRLETGTKTSVSKIFVLFCPFVVQNGTAHVDTKALKRAISQKIVFRLYSLEFYNIKNGTSYTYLVHRKYFLHMMLYLTKTI